MTGYIFASSTVSSHTLPLFLSISNSFQPLTLASCLRPELSKAEFRRLPRGPLQRAEVQVPDRAVSQRPTDGLWARPFETDNHRASPKVWRMRGPQLAL